MYARRSKQPGYVDPYEEAEREEAPQDTPMSARITLRGRVTTVGAIVNAWESETKKNKSLEIRINQLQTELQQKSGRNASSSASKVYVASDSQWFRLVALFAIFLVGVGIVLADAYWSVSAYALMEWIPADWNRENWKILWGLLGSWSWYMLLQVPISAIQLSMTPFRWIGWKNRDGSFRIPFRWSNLEGHLIFFWFIAFFINIGTTFIGISTDMVSWKPLQIFSEMPWPTEGGAHNFICFSLASFIALSGERVITTSVRGMIEIVKEIRLKS